MPVIANRAFQWVMCSCWPLSPEELVAAVCQDPETDEVDEVDISINVVLGACQNLLVVDQELNTCRFSHLSVQEYFETHLWSSCEMHCLVGKVCLSLLVNDSTTLNQDAPPSKKEDRDKHAHDFLEYACINWITHVQRVEESGISEHRLTALLKSFLGSMDRSSFAYQNWYKMTTGFFDSRSRHSRSYYKLPLHQVYERLSPCSWSSFAIATFGFHRAIFDWWTICFGDINQKNFDGESLLLLGAAQGSATVAGNLLKRGADVNATGGQYGNALQAASYHGHEAVVQLLLDGGADVNASGGYYGSALQAASYHGHDRVVHLLLKNGANVNASGGYYGSALQAASIRSPENIVQLLQDQGADVNSSGGRFGSALQAASYYGRRSVVQLLLDNGADMNAAGENNGNALEAASYWGHESVVRLLLDKGANINAAGGMYGSALQAASYSGHESVVRLLLDKGADVNATGGEYSSALEIASIHGHETVVQLLQTARKPH